MRTSGVSKGQLGETAFVGGLQNARNAAQSASIGWLCSGRRVTARARPATPSEPPG